jgi:DmsE family decaheme c-type cytochrome
MALRLLKRHATRLAVLAGVMALAAAALSARQAPPPQAAPPAGQLVYTQNAVQSCLRECHDRAPVNLILQTPHAVKADARTPFAQHQCETCHGASPAHIETSSNPVAIVFKGPKASPVADRNAKCLSCHEAGLRAHWSGSQHEARGVACTDCHTIHAREQKVLSKATQADVCFNCHKAQRAQTRRISTHPLAVTSLANRPFMACSDCHNPHGSTGPKMLVKNSVNETCFTCHAEKRGPFLWEHAPVADECTNCHTPHGSTTAPLLKARVPWLCQDCHSGDHGNQINSAANLVAGGVTTVNGAQAGTSGASPRAQLSARACLNCHVMVHGSNSPAGSKFQR